ncbi:MAG TPA: membrane dipeptidase, partial [Anaerolineales bacterium]
MPLIVDSHSDIAWNMLAFGRDYTRAVEETRRLEAGTRAVELAEDTLIGWPEYQRGCVAVVFATLYAPPVRWAHNEMEMKFAYRTSDEANRIYRQQLISYQRLTDDMPDKFRLVTRRKDLEEVLAQWEIPELPDGSGEGHPVGLVPLMEGADGVRSPAELEEWFELGLRLIGLAWVATRYSGGWREPGPLAPEGRVLLEAMADHGFILDLSHMDEPAMLEALDRYRGPVVATHGNCLALLPDFPSNRQFSDRVLEGIIERDGVVGVVPYNGYLKVGWTKGRSRREEVGLEVVVNHIDHICQIAGDALHAGIGSDFDGGFGMQSVPPEIESVADLQKIAPLLMQRGYTEADAA